MTGGLAQQLSRYCAIGFLATATHVIVALACHRFLVAPPLAANLAGFWAAWLISYLGNHKWTFGSNSAHGRSAPRYMVVAAVGLAANQAIVWMMTDAYRTSFLAALFAVVLIVPALSFVLSRWWAFQDRGHAAADRATR